MHCPRCGQQQISEDTRFCSRCGMPLDLVAEVVANGGTLPQLGALNANTKWLSRKNGFKFSAIWFVVLVMILLPLAGVTGAPEEVAGSLAILGFFGSFLLILLSWMFLPKEMKLNVGVPAYQPDATSAQFLGGKRAPNALPPQQSIPVSAYAPPAPGSWRDTNELQPTSVTEGTTKIFKETN
ncbi:MAG: zinc ribbon domain-containing protein [Acidobacteria bacterium]|nr:zinc ribbon domain-containing protein [Acidobacteriota bacterium]MBK8811302.1 zinc ribbon domain-containing protein [Acidobacteriota bacterium]